VVNTTGITRPAMIDKMTLPQWEQVLRVHLTGTFLCMQAVARLIARHKAGEKTAGAIVNISSDAGRQGTIRQINYSQSWRPGRDHERGARVGTVWRSSKHGIIRAGRDADDGDDPRREIPRHVSCPHSARAMEHPRRSSASRVLPFVQRDLRSDRAATCDGS
jgi:hypothetical protein